MCSAPRRGAHYNNKKTRTVLASGSQWPSRAAGCPLTHVQQLVLPGAVAREHHGVVCAAVVAKSVTYPVLDTVNSLVLVGYQNPKVLEHVVNFANTRG